MERTPDEMRLTDYAESTHVIIPRPEPAGLAQQWWFRAPLDLYHLMEYEIQTQSRDGITFEYC